MTTRRISSRASLALAALAVLVGCRGGQRPVADYEVLVSVKRYNQALPSAYAKASAGQLSGTATADEMQRVDDIISFLAQGRMVMDARQETFEAGSVRHEGADRASVEATEVWWYRHWNPGTGEVKQAARRVRYRNRFTCLKLEGRWLVDKLEELGFEKLPEARAAR